MEAADSNDVARLTFFGAAGEVTGSCYLLETRTARVLFECGMLQGGREAEAHNRAPFPFDPASLDAVVLTHAHIDHSGMVPRLVRDGFTGSVHVTDATGSLLRIMLPDSAHIHEQDALRATRWRAKRGKEPVRPLYTTVDAEAALRTLEPHDFDVRVEVVPGLQVRFRRAGHILGAASVEAWIQDASVTRKIVFSGDLGRAADPMLRDPDPPEEADLLLIETTYGDRDHKDLAQSIEELASILEDAGARGGNVVIPVFAVGRAQEILFQLSRLERLGRLKPRPVCFDSPMAIHVSEIYPRHADCLEPALRGALFGPDHPLEPAQLELCRTPEESMALNDRHGIIILAASGMCEAGRVVHHLKHNLPRPGAHVVIVGFQARGTTGRALVDGAREVRVLGEEVQVNAQVHTVGGFSAHAGCSDLLAWATPLLKSGTEVALVHGEPDRRDAFAELIAPLAPSHVHKPLRGDRIVLTARGGRMRFERAD